MQIIAANGLAAFERFGSQRPAMAVGRGEDRRLQIGSQIIPQSFRAIEVAIAGLLEEVLKTVRLR
ncbi:hypothetical protein A33O_20585 [Nitratireductor aquibiodomus RA22]|uniref:Uncharacterized protein n=1 Tax=Nitratireductor aquibiodomus RA22 TaxID=1189611 RepID=I5BRL3_9HYPH|nr:hypothetical protein A33O_20585 [Nitratireductor aquibiodomus RA22]